MNPNSFITPKQRSDLFWSAGFAYIINQPLNYKVVLRIHENRKAHAKFIKYFSDWFAYQTGNSACWIYTLEAYSPFHRHPHANIICHLPLSLHSKFHNLSAGWLHRSGIPVRKGTIQSAALYEISNPDPVQYLVRGLLGSLSYATKGAADRDQPQGLIIGKRSGYSESLSPVLHKHHQFSDQELARLRLLQSAWSDHPMLIPAFKSKSSGPSEDLGERQCM